jgi:hypothetical protein
MSKPLPFLPQPKSAPRLKLRMAKARDLDQAWRDCCRYVDQRDRYKCRVCGRRVVKTLTLCAERAEHHHLEARSLVPALKHDVRNVILCCASCHLKLTQHQIEPTGTERFEYQGHSYLNADCPLIFLS